MYSAGPFDYAHALHGEVVVLFRFVYVCTGFVLFLALWGLRAAFYALAKTCFGFFIVFWSTPHSLSAAVCVVLCFRVQEQIVYLSECQEPCPSSVKYRLFLSFFSSLFGSDLY